MKFTVGFTIEDYYSNFTWNDESGLGSDPYLRWSRETGVGFVEDILYGDPIAHKTMNSVTYGKRLPESYSFIFNQRRHAVLFQLAFKPL